jgi:Acetoacetate decarboxylase (ADC)
VGTSPPAPWVLGGESIVGLARWPGRPPPLPPSLRPIPGPWLVAAVRYTGSPVGPYLELAVAQPARLGARVAWCVQLMAVDSPDSRVGGRLHWGLPKELATLRWEERGAERSLTWEERGVVVRGRPFGLPIPGLVPVRALQQRGDGPVVVPGRLRGTARLAAVRVEVDGARGADLLPLAGRHPGLAVSGMQLVIREARTPTGVLAAIRTAQRVPRAAVW